MTEAAGVPVLTTPTDALKPGWKTTEWWKSVAVSLTGLLATSGLLGDGSTVTRIGGLVAMAISTFGYSIARGMAKS